MRTILQQLLRQEIIIILSSWRFLAEVTNATISIYLLSLLSNLVRELLKTKTKDLRKEARTKQQRSTKDRIDNLISQSRIKFNIS